ncbi:MAG: response regulator [Deltaproteobacteria bacterium]|nr:response regulator [Deltaproteobacteria bacterium]MBK8716259.1 response regulator [Deltaproteobacteria bacterium]MBP7292071.1 response regulator [Nannocystaceae bacterium]
MWSEGTLGLTSKHLLNALLSHAPVRVSVIDRDGTFLLLSSRPELVGRNAFEEFKGNPVGLAHIRRALEGEDQRWVENIGDQFFQIQAVPVREPGGAVAGIMLITTIVTEQVSAQEQLTDSEARFRHIMDSNMIPIMFWDEDGMVSDANDALLQLLGRTRAELEAGVLRWADAELGESAEADDRARAEIIERGSCTPYEKELLHSSGARVPVLVGGARLDRTRSSGVAFIVDLSERRRRDRERDDLQAKLLQVQKLESLGLLAGGIAHDFNNLLTAVLGGAATALLSVPPEHPARPDLDNVLEAARRAADLTRQLLAYSGKGHFQIKPIDLSEMVRGLVALLETTISKKVQLRLELLPSLPAIEADSAQLQQILMNLVINGAEAIGDEAGTVLVTTGAQDVDEGYAGELFAAEQLPAGRYVFVEVHDTGIGMDDDTKARIFDPFFTTKFTGRGLGLAAVLGIVRSHRGAIRVYSSPGRGTTFKVFFPATNAKPARRERSSVEFKGSGLVLVVDDDASVRGAMRRMLTHFGFTVLEAENGREGVDVFRNRASEIAMILLDMTMPVMGGEEAFRELRAIRPDVPVILTSGYNEIEATRRFTAKGLTGFLQKPFTPSEMIAKIEPVLRSGAG